MAINPAKQGEALNSPVERASKLNDPQFENQQGYFPYDLTHQEFITPRFGEVTPSMCLDTVPGDRTVVRDNTKLILNQINGNFLSNLNQYVDSFYVPLRNVFPNNYEKLIPNPVKGEDLPNSALPVVPLLAYLRELYYVDDIIRINGEDSRTMKEMIDENLFNDAPLDSLTQNDSDWLVGRITLLATILSRGQLLDYLGFTLDTNSLRPNVTSQLQEAIDNYFRTLWSVMSTSDFIESRGMVLTDPDLTSDYRYHNYSDLSSFRNALADIFEAGRFPLFGVDFTLPEPGNEDILAFTEAMRLLISILESLLNAYTVSMDVSHIEEIDALESMNAAGHFNIGRILAYQQVIAHYYSNDRVDNVYSSELFMQNLRSIMYPTISGDFTTSEPTFDMNGVRYEYDYISYGGFWSSLLTNQLMAGYANRQYVWATIMLLLRRSLRYGDYFSTARVNMLAVSDQLSIAVEGGQVSPIDVTRNLLMQRYLNSVNYSGQQFLNYMSSIFGIKPSDTGCIPRFISHRKIEIENRVTNNTAENQGAQTTNLVGYSDASAFDVFIDDFGYLLSLTSFDVLPVYKSGIEGSFHFADRFDYFNPMLQGIGDQPIRTSELLSDPVMYDDVFGYTMRNAEYKYKVSKAHGAFVNSLPGFMLAYPLSAYNPTYDEFDVNIDPDFIRDKPVYLDPVVPQMTGISPGEYFHFVVSCTNQVHCARKIQATPGVLF